MIGKLIRILRQENKIGVIALADKMRISRISLYRIEKGQREPSEATAIKAFQFLGLPEAVIYRIFVLHDLHKHGALSPTTKKSDVALFLKRLNKGDNHSRIIYRYFQEEFHDATPTKNKKKQR